jgi:hypothetical protein
MSDRCRLFILDTIYNFLLFTGDDDSKRPSRQQPLNSELILSKEQLYDMFQQILGVKKFEHQILFNALMVRFYLSVDIPNTEDLLNNRIWCEISLQNFL